jgi:plastocyanin
MKRWVVTACAMMLAGCTATRREEAKAPEYFRVDPATAAVIQGKVSFAGKPAAPRKINMDEDTECLRLNPGGLHDESLLVNRDGTLRNVLVYVKSGLEGKSFESPSEPVVLNQQGCRFDPRVFGIQTGQPFQATNSDPITHNVHPLAKVNREWNQSQAPGDPPLQRRFAKPEIIRIKCNIHFWMRSWVAVMDHPYFAVTGSDGSFEIPNLPPGDYVIEAWHETAGTEERKIHLEPSGKSELTFKLSAQ